MNRDLSLRQQDLLGIAEEILGKGKSFSFRATGTSMSPFIKDRDIVIIKPCKNSVKTGDAVLLKTIDGRLIIHRVIKKLRSGVITRGDAVESDDGFTPHSNILGRVVKVSGSGYNFHLKFPFKYLIGKRIIFSNKIHQYPLISNFGKKILKLLS